MEGVVTQIGEPQVGVVHEVLDDLDLDLGRGRVAVAGHDVDDG